MTKICRHFALGETGRYDKVQERDQTKKAPSVCLAVFFPDCADHDGSGVSPEIVDYFEIEPSRSSISSS